jgi:hypothetical protein
MSGGHCNTWASFSDGVRRVIVITEDNNGRSTACGGVEYERDEMCLGVVPLSAKNHPPGCIEVTQRDRPDSVWRVVVRKDALEYQLRASVWVRRIGGVALRYRHCRRIAIHGGTRREHDVGNIRLDERIEQTQRPYNIAIEVGGRIAHRLSDSDLACEVDTSVDPELIHQRGHEVAITNVASHESSSFIDGVCIPCRQIVEYDDIFARIDKGIHGDRAVV